MSQYDEDLDNYNWLASEVDLHETGQALALGKLLISKLNPDSVIDIGCSSGIYLTPYKDVGCEVLGIDGASGVGQHLDRLAAEFQVVDLREPWHPQHRYDLCLCIEVGEHLDPQYADILMDTIARCADTVFYCAARPGQGGEHHTNEQPRSYWEQKFRDRGYELNNELTNYVHSNIDNNPVYQHCGWLIWNSFVATKSS